MPPSTASSSTILSFEREHQHGAPVPNRPILAERRLKLRYLLDLSVRFRSISGASLFSGAGRSVKVSSGGVLVVSKDVVAQHEMSAGVWLEMSIEWPSLLDRRTPLQLFAVGRILRRGSSSFAATFERYQFRTMKSSVEVVRGSGNVT